MIRTPKVSKSFFRQPGNPRAGGQKKKKKAIGVGGKDCWGKFFKKNAPGRGREKVWKRGGGKKDSHGMRAISPYEKKRRSQEQGET